MSENGFVPRTDEEILEKLKTVEHFDPLGLCAFDDLAGCLSYEAAKPYLKEGVKESDWTPLPKDYDYLVERMREYMPFALEKARNRRSISACRSLIHYTCWLWLARVDLGKLMDYDNYGIDKLIQICEYFGWDADEM